MPVVVGAPAAWAGWAELPRATRPMAAADTTATRRAVRLLGGEAVTSGHSDSQLFSRGGRHYDGARQGGGGGPVLQAAAEPEQFAEGADDDLGARAAGLAVQARIVGDANLGEGNA